jgi:hypothetical protein
VDYKEALQHYSPSFKFLKEWKEAKGLCCPEARVERVETVVGGGSQIAFFVAHVSDLDDGNNKRPRLVKRYLLSHHSMLIAACRGPVRLPAIAHILGPE